jgi:hypothetical protein
MAVSRWFETREGSSRINQNARASGTNLTSDEGQDRQLGRSKRAPIIGTWQYDLQLTDETFEKVLVDKICVIMRCAKRS